MRKSKQSITKSSKTKLNTIWQKTAKSLAVSSGNVANYQHLTGKDVLQEKNLSEKAATRKSFEYSPIGSELEKQTDTANKNIMD